MENFTDLNCSQINFANKTCFEFSERGFYIALWLRTGLAFLAAVMCIVAIIIIFLLKAYKKFIHRLVLYLCLAALFTTITIAIQLAPVKQMCEHVSVKSVKFCTAAAALILYSDWATVILIIWIGIHFFIMAVFSKDYQKSRKYELCIILTAVLLPIVFCVIPFVHIHKIKMYGLAGAWCWIRSTDEECHEIKAGVIEQFVLWYAPAMLFALLFFFIMVVVNIALCMKKKKAAAEQQNQFSRSLKEMRPLLFYPTIYSVVYSLVFANRIYYAATQKAVLGHWILNAIVDPMFFMIIPLAFFVHLKIRKRLNCQELRKAINSWRLPNEDTYFSVSNEGEEERERLIIRGRQINSAGVSSFLGLPN